MVFPSVPIYLYPHNWNQQTFTTGGNIDVHQLPTTATPQPVAAVGASVRPGSMAERARLAKIPQPELALNCPRCDSTNTKFCYFNNYSLSQPRHFCKTCRRYWTRGGTLRNVPVGGGCRRNKRSKSSSSSTNGASSSSTTMFQAVVASTASSSSTATSASSSEILPSAPLPFMAPWHQLPDFGLSAIPVAAPMENAEFSLGLEQWRIQQIQQFPFFGGMETSTSPAAPAAPMVPGFYSFEEKAVGGMDGSASYPPGGSIHGKLALVKTENGSQGLNLPRQLLSIPRNDEQQFWGVSEGAGGRNIGSSSGGDGGGWRGDFSGYNPSSRGSVL